VNAKKLTGVGMIFGMGILVGLMLVPNVWAQSSPPNIHFISAGLNCPPACWAKHFDVCICYRLAWPAWFEFGGWCVVRSKAGNGGSTAARRVRSASPATGGSILRSIGRISKVTAPLQVTTVIDGLPSGKAICRRAIHGVADVAFIGNVRAPCGWRIARTEILIIPMELS
jgi:hypothetical protein